MSAILNSRKKLRKNRFLARIVFYFSFFKSKVDWQVAKTYN